MKEPEWLLRETVLALQERLLSEFGGLGGLRDEGLLDSALARPQQLFAYGRPSLFELAAAYAFGLVRNHPFLDGNKRIGFTAAILFLELNGRHFAASEADAALKTLALAAREIDEAAYAAWLQANSRKQGKEINTDEHGLELPPASHPCSSVVKKTATTLSHRFSAR